MQTSCTTKNKRKPSSFNAIGPFVESFEHSRSRQESDTSYEYETTDQEESGDERCALSKSTWLKISFAFSIVAMGVILLLALTLCQTTNDRFATAMRFEGPYNDVVQDKSAFLEDCNSALEELKCTSVESHGENGILVNFEGKRSAASNLKAQYSNAHDSGAMRSFLQILEEGLKLSNGTTLYPKHVHENVGLKADLEEAKAELEEKQTFLETEISSKKTEIDELNEKNARLEEQQRNEIDNLNEEKARLQEQQKIEIDKLKKENVELEEQQASQEDKWKEEKVMLEKAQEDLIVEKTTLKIRLMHDNISKGKQHTSSCDSTEAPQSGNASSSASADGDHNEEEHVDQFYQLLNAAKLKTENDSLKSELEEKRQSLQLAVNQETKERTLKKKLRTHIKRMQARKKRDESQKEEHAQLHEGQRADTERFIQRLICAKEQDEGMLYSYRNRLDLLWRQNQELAQKVDIYSRMKRMDEQCQQTAYCEPLSECPTRCNSNADDTSYQDDILQPHPIHIDVPVLLHPKTHNLSWDSRGRSDSQSTAASETDFLSPVLKAGVPPEMQVRNFSPIPEGQREEGTPSPVSICFPDRTIHDCQRDGI